VLQCVAVCCIVLQCVALCCSVLQCVAVCCSVLHCVAVCCSVLQCVDMRFGVNRLAFDEKEIHLHFCSDTLPRMNILGRVCQDF